MLRKCIFLLSLIFSLAVHAETDAKKPPVYTDTAKGILATRDASEFTIQIPTNFTTGYSWFLSKYDASLITPLRYEYKPPENRDLVGAPGVTLWTFRVLPAAFLVPRQTQIEFVSVRPWDTIEAGKTLTFTVNASAAGF